MSSFVQKYNIQKGDVVITPKSIFGMAQHYVVYEGYNSWGQEIWYDNNNIVGVRAITTEQFIRENQNFTRIRRFIGNDYQRQFAIQRAQSKLGTKYDLANWNCEHFANYVQFVQVKSNQSNLVKGLFVAAASVAVIGIFGEILGD